LFINPDPIAEACGRINEFGDNHRRERTPIRAVHNLVELTHHDRSASEGARRLAASRLEFDERRPRARGRVVYRPVPDEPATNVPRWARVEGRAAN
jgi:hypothetical protein